MSGPIYNVDFRNDTHRQACDWLVDQGWAKRNHYDHVITMTDEIYIVENNGQTYSWAWFSDPHRAMLFKLTWGGA